MLKSDAQPMPRVRAILASDIHLQAKAPVARSTEPDWFEAMARPLREIEDLKDRYKCPVLYAGDIFDRWNAAPEVINFALQNLPQGYAIPGQHDLPNHNYDDIKRSAYWTLVESGKIEDIPPSAHPTLIRDGLYAYGFPWGFKPVPKQRETDGLCVALVHQFIWTTKATGYTGATQESRIGASMASLAGYDAVAFGDNHKGFITRPTASGPAVCNCGGMMRRKTDERDAQPGVGLLWSDGTVTRHYFDTTADRFIQLTAETEAVEKLLDMTDFVIGLRELSGDDALDFETALRQFLDTNKTAKRVRDIILDTIR